MSRFNITHVRLFPESVYTDWLLFEEAGIHRPLAILSETDLRRMRAVKDEVRHADKMEKLTSTKEV
jgi:hypothetical protein